METLDERIASKQESALAARSSDIAGQTMLPAVVEGVLGSLGAKAFHNFKGDAMAIWRQVAKATGPTVGNADDIIGKEFKLERFYVHQIQLAQEGQGEYVDAVRCVLIDPSDNAFAFVSTGIAGDLARIISTFGMGPYLPPIIVKIVSFTTAKKRKSYSIQPA